MQLSTKGLALLKNSEGFRSQSYLDVAGIRTIAYGHRILPTESFPNGIDEAQGAELLTGDVRVAENAVKRLVKVELVQCQFDGMLNIGRYGAAADELLRWDHAGAHENAGLKARREAEFMLWHSADSGQLPVA
jgi:lysozyme